MAEDEEDQRLLRSMLDAERRHKARAAAARSLFHSLWGRLVFFYRLVCVLVIVIGLDALYPAAGRHLAYAFRDPALALSTPFASCQQAQANGYFNIPAASKGYAADQDYDGDGVACEPPAHRWPQLTWRLRTVVDRLREPWW